MIILDRFLGPLLGVTIQGQALIVSWVHNVALQRTIHLHFLFFRQRKIIAKLLNICKTWNAILLGLGPESDVRMHKRGVKCNTLGLLTQFKILASPARQVRANEPRRAEQEPACTATADAPVGRVCKNEPNI